MSSLITKPNFMDFSSAGINNVLKVIKVRNPSTKPLVVVSKITSSPKLVNNSNNNGGKTAVVGTKRCYEGRAEKEGPVMKKRYSVVLDYDTSVSLYKYSEKYQRPSSKVASKGNATRPNNSKTVPKGRKTQSVQQVNKLSNVTNKVPNNNLSTKQCKQSSTCKSIMPSDSQSSSEASSCLDYEGSSQQELSSIDEPQSERAAMLRQRYANIISKSRQQLEMLGTKTQNRVEQQSRVVSKSTVQSKKLACDEAEAIKRSRQRERQAARVALEKMEQTVVFEDNMRDYRELEALVGRPLSIFDLDREKYGVSISMRFRH